MEEAYGVMGIFDRMRDPRAIPGAGVAPPVLLFSRDGVAFLELVLLLSWKRRRNCSLFMAGDGWGRCRLNGRIADKVAVRVSWRLYSAAYS